MEKREHAFSWGALTRIVMMGIIVILAWRALSIFPNILIACVLAAAFYPLVHRVEKKTRLPHILSIVLVLIVPLVLIIVLVAHFIPAIASQLPDLVTNLSASISHLSFAPDSFRNFDLLQYFQSHLDYVSATKDLVFTLFSIIETLILSFYLIYDSQRLLELFLHTIPEKEQGNIKALLEEIATVTGKYIRGNVLISCICGTIIFIGLTLLNIPFALPLAIFAGIFDLLPLVGPSIGAIPAVIVALGISPLSCLFVIILYLAYQETENAIISPMIYNKALNLFPAISFFSVLVGGALFGVLGAFLALPVAASIPATIQFQKNYKKRHQA